MAYGKKTGGRDIQKGQVLNPLGGAAQDPVIRQLRRMTRADVAEVGQLIVAGNLPELMKVHEDPTATVLKVWMAAIAIKAINKGDADALNKLLEQIMGRVPLGIYNAGSMGQIVPQAVAILSDDELRAAGERLTKEIIDVELEEANHPS